MFVKLDPCYVFEPLITIEQVEPHPCSVFLPFCRA